MKTIALALGLSLTATAHPLLAQGAPRPGGPPAAPGEIRGHVVDASSGSPLSAASVEVRSAADSALVTGTLAQTDGSFHIQGLRPGAYLLRIVMIGYETHVGAPLELTAASPRASAGRIGLAARAIELEGVVAEAERPAIIAPDRNIYSVKQVAPAATSATDVLENVPSLAVDADGKVSLRGNENVVVQINGRPTPMSGLQLAGYLKQMPANTIERVEVVTNPSAKEDPEGMAGIINIVMKQGVDLGSSLGLTLGASTEDRYNVGINFGHQAGPLAVSGNYGFYADERVWLGINDRTRLAPAGAALSYTEQDLNGNNGNNGHNLALNADYTLTPRDVLSTTFRLNRREMDEGSLAAYSILDGSRELIDEYDRLRDARSTNWFGDGLLSYKRTFAPQKHELTAELRYNKQDETEWTELWRGALDPARLDVETNDVEALEDQLTGQLDYTRTLGEAYKLEAGYKANARSLDRDFEVMNDRDGTGAWVRSDLSNALAFDETVHAGYAVLSRGGEKFDVQAGLRAERAAREFSLLDGERFPHTYNSLFPSGLISFKADDETQVKLSYSRRIRRPGTQELNPFPVFFDLQNVFLGNPQLGPEYTDAVELSYQRSMQLGSIQVAPFYRRTTDIIRIDIDTDAVVSGREVTAVSFRNLDHGSSWGADVNGQIRYKKLSGLAGFNVFKMVTDGGSESALSSDAVMWMARLNGTLNLSPATSVQAMYFYRAPAEFERGKFFAMQFLNVSVRQKLTDKATAVIRFSDPFKTQQFRVQAENDDLIQLTNRRFNSRALHVTLQWNYGKPPRLRQRTQEEQPQSSVPFSQ